MDQEIKIDSCPEGALNGTCKTEDCIFQEGKWKGENVPALSINQDEKEKLNWRITCDDMTE
ncbi:MAG TPA: hypothetical protein PKL30_22755 [Leptospiraceae bacterium]|jgi:hypothetical protein|nr:hypothetical protein [Leptospiraceae bacterium]HNA09489.1 hypothetical protein [Leptospiraceae bacterium]HNF57430.1 hypothetical protein [Leptospiraceae bacterium]HNH03039.1 hypothetical protein [Leptospiraceae bacterium]HNH57841.1 hypothetical protein [Leptospiraceae bacterium]